MNEKRDIKSSFRGLITLLAKLISDDFYRDFLLIYKKNLDTSISLRCSRNNFRCIKHALIDIELDFCTSSKISPCSLITFKTRFKKSMSSDSGKGHFFCLAIDFTSFKIVKKRLRVVIQYPQRVLAGDINVNLVDLIMHQNF